MKKAEGKGREGAFDLWSVPSMTVIALMTAVLCVCGPLSIPLGPVPISLTTFVIYLLLYVTGTARGVMACCLYILVGLVGLPVFSGYVGGPGKLFGPTGGYIIGYIPMALIIGLFLEKHWQNRVACILVMEAATWLLYPMGTAWLAVQMNLTFQAALSAGVIPFILGDLVKIVVAAIFGPVLKARLRPVI